MIEKVALNRCSTHATLSAITQGFIRVFIKIY